MVLKDVNLAVRPGEFWFFLGPNGVGKTTLVKALLGMLPVQEGDFSQSQFRQPGVDRVRSSAL